MKEVTEQDVQHVRELVASLLEGEDVNDEHDDKAQVLQQVQDDAAVRRFVRAAGYNHKGAAKRLVTTARWRLEAHSEKLSCATCQRNPKSHFMHAVGHDLRGRPVLFSSYIMIEDAGAQGATQHMLCEFEHAIKLMPPSVESWVWIMDFRGYGRRLADLSPTLAVNFLRLSAAHYPERLGALWILDAPAVLMPVWRWLKPMIDPVTHAKFRFLPFDVPRTGQLPPYAPPASTATPTPATAAPPAAAPDAGNHTTATPAATPTQPAAPDAGADTVAAATPAEPHPAAAGEAHAPPDSHTATASAAAPHKSHLWAALCEMCDLELATWVVDEMRAARTWDDNKRKKRGAGEREPHRPVYDFALLQRALGEARDLPNLLALLGPEGMGMAGDGRSGHSHYGTATFLSKLLQARAAGAGAEVVAAAAGAATAEVAPAVTVTAAG